MDDEKQRPSNVFAARLAELRRERGLSLEALAELMRDRGGFPTMSKSAVQRVETGERGLSLDEALGFAAVLWAVPSQMLSPPDDETVWVSDQFGVDGGGEMRQWLRFGASFIAEAGDLPDEQVEDLKLRAIARHARALLDAIQFKDKAGQKEAAQAIADIFLTPGVAPAELKRREDQ
jgi:transcriptional regulator with XRE-family HTH domain